MLVVAEAFQALKKGEKKQKAKTHKKGKTKDHEGKKHNPDRQESSKTSTARAALICMFDIA